MGQRLSTSTNQRLPNLWVETMFLEPLYCYVTMTPHAPLPVSSQLLQMFCITLYQLLSTQCIHLMFAYTYRLPAVSFKSNRSSVHSLTFSSMQSIPRSHLNCIAIKITTSKELGVSLLFDTIVDAGLLLLIVLRMPYLRVQWLKDSLHILWQKKNERNRAKYTWSEPLIILGSSEAM